MHIGTRCWHVIVNSPPFSRTQVALKNHSFVQSKSNILKDSIPAEKKHLFAVLSENTLYRRCCSAVTFLYVQIKSICFSTAALYIMVVQWCCCWGPQLGALALFRVESLLQNKNCEKREKHG